MKRIFSLAAAVTTTGIMLAMHCAAPNGGNGSQTTNSRLAGVLYNPDHTRASHARVVLVPSGYNPHGSSLSKTLAATSSTFDSTFTDDTGGYWFDTIPADTCNILSSRSGNLCFHDSVIVPADSHCIIPPDTLKAPGSLNGIIQLQGTDNPTTVFILVFGTNVWAAPQDSTGNFSLTNMAEGSYHVRILTTLDAYKPLDTTLKIQTGKIDTLPPIQLQYTGIPVPTGVHIQYDTMKQIVTLLWNKPTTGRAVKSYNVYRGNIDSNKTPTILNTQIVTDTVYHDSTGVQDMSYEYQVAGVDSNGGEGTKSGGVTIIITSPFRTVQVFSLPNLAWKIALKNNLGKRIYCFGTGDSVTIFDSAGSRKSAFRVFPTADDIAADGQDNLYSVYWGDTVVNKWTPDDSLSSNWKFREFYQLGYGVSPQPRFKIIDTSAICIFDERQVVTYTMSGIYINQFLLPTGQRFAGAKSRDSLLIYDSLGQGLKWCNHDWQTSGVIPLQSMPLINTVQTAKIYNDTLIVLQIMLQNTNLQNETYLYFINPLKGTLAARLKINATDFGIGIDGRVYVLIAGRSVAIYERQGW